MNDYELIYLYQRKISCKRILAIFYYKYSALLKTIAWQVYKKFYYLRIHHDDLFFLSYECLSHALQNYNQNNKIKFLNYLWKITVWHLLNKIQSTIRYQKRIMLGADEEKFQTLGWKKHAHEMKKYHLAKITTKLHLLSKKELWVLNYKIKGWSITKIGSKLGLSYKQVDNTWQRTVRKVRFLAQKFNFYTSLD